MRILSVDPGEVRIGIAISDETASFSRPLTVIKHISRPENAARIIRLAEENECGLIIVGAPLDSDGGIGLRARASLKLAEAMRLLTQIRVEIWDESDTSKKADQIALQLGYRTKKRAAPKDAEAAALLLQDYLDAQDTINHDRN